jgi:hypothetical protein
VENNERGETKLKESYKEIRKGREGRKKSKVKQSLYTPWRHLGGEEV